MIKSANEMIKAIRREEWRGLVLYEGPSMIDGQPIVVIANRICEASNNAKTGDMVQTFIIRSDVAPLEALKTGDDQSVCGDCIHRPRMVNGKRLRSCYVNVGQAPRSVFVAYQNGRYARPDVDYDPAILADVFAGRVFRCGTYGDPFAAPFHIWKACLEKVAGLTGYTHQWRDPFCAPFKHICMASCDGALDAELAKAKGWRVFRVRQAKEDIRAGEVVCPASAEAGKKTVCAACKACGGFMAKAKADIVITAHGPTAKHFGQ